MSDIIQLKNIINNNKSNMSSDDYINIMSHIDNLNKIINMIHKIKKLMEIDPIINQTKIDNDNIGDIDLTNIDLLKTLKNKQLQNICKFKNITGNILKLKKNELIDKIIQLNNMKIKEKKVISEDKYNLSNKKKKELQEICKSMGLTKYSTLNIQGLIKLINENNRIYEEKFIISNDKIDDESSESSDDNDEIEQKNNNKHEVDLLTSDEDDEDDVIEQKNNNKHEVDLLISDEDSNEDHSENEDNDSDTD